MKASAIIITVLLYFMFAPGTPRDCLKITCLNPADTVSVKIGERRSVFLLESPADTLSGFEIRSSCGCEYPVYNKQMKIFPGHPDTVVVVSLLKGHSGKWHKQTTLVTGHCIQAFYTGPWWVGQ